MVSRSMYVVPRFGRLQMGANRHEEKTLAARNRVAALASTALDPSLVHILVADTMQAYTSHPVILYNSLHEHNQFLQSQTQPRDILAANWTLAHVYCR